MGRAYAGVGGLEGHREETATNERRQPLDIPSDQSGV